MSRTGHDDEHLNATQSTGDLERSSSPSHLAHGGASAPNLSLEPGQEEDYSHIERQPDHHKARLIKAAYFSPNPPTEGAEGQASSSGAADQPEDGFSTERPYHSRPGGDIVSDIYNFVDQAQQPSGRGGARLTRSATFAGPEDFPDSSSGSHHHHEHEQDFKAIMQPGGFRRNYLAHRQGANEDDDALETGSALSRTPSATTNINHSNSNGGNGNRPPSSIARPQAMRKHPRSFVDFLVHSSGVTHLYGQDLEEYDEDEDDDVPQEVHERTALLNEHMRRRQAMKNGSGEEGSGDATVAQATLMLLKSFIGTGVLFLGKAFFNGGILFSSLTLSGIALVSLYSFVLLVKARLVVPGGFGDIAGKLYGQWLRTLVLTSIALSQIGFVSAYFVFVAENLQAFFLSVSACQKYIPLEWLIFGQLVVYIPLAMVRNISKLSPTALIADVIIFTGIAYIFGTEISVIAKNGVADVQLFNRNDFSLLLGTAVFAFEGIGLIIPITSSMREPHKFPPTLAGVMIGLILLFVASGVLAYAAYGSSVETIIFYNLPQRSKFVSAVQFMYSTAIILSAPLQLFPAIRIIENGLFSRSGKFSNRVKWQKNTLRFCICTLCATIAYGARADLDKFVSLIGSFACVPLSYNYPAMLHYKACARTQKQKVIDVLIFIFGTITCLYCSVQTVSSLRQPSTNSEGPQCIP